MGKVRDLRGQRFGRLKVPPDAEPEMRGRHAYWPVECACGGPRKWVRGSKLRDGSTRSCGCQRADSGVRSRARLEGVESRRELQALIGAKGLDINLPVLPDCAKGVELKIPVLPDCAKGIEIKVLIAPDPVGVEDEIVHGDDDLSRSE